MTKTINWGVLGASKFAREQMARAIHSAQNARLSALATSSRSKAEGFESFCPSIRVFTDYQALLDDPEIDAVYIPLPNHLHVEWTRKALGAGKHVLCEKPIALKECEFDDLISARDVSGCQAAEAFMIVHHPQWIRTQELVQDGAIGELRHIQGFFTYNNESDTNNIRQIAEYGGGGVRDIGVYPIGAARCVTGIEPDKISARLTMQNGIDTFADMRAMFGDVSFNAIVGMRQFALQDMVFNGSKGLIRLTAPFNPGVYGEAQLRLHSASGALQLEKFPTANHYVLQVEAFGRSIRDGAPYPWPLEIARGTQGMIDTVLADA